ncbi:MAG: 3'-5' exonuclease [Thermoflexaceae bacterium]|nr:3'-5' exonuclease [Thermoflexaceae bacterium]
MTDQREIFVSVDVETAGPIPGEYSLLAIGACAVYEPRLTFSSELKPINRNADPKALEVTGLSLDHLERTGLPPADAMRSFARWLDSLREGDGLLVFVGFNAPFDWSFVNYYFHTFHGSNPFGFAALDIKSYYMGQSNTTWSETTSSKMAAILRPQTVGDHDPLHDAIYQAELFRLVRQRVRGHQE